MEKCALVTGGAVRIGRAFNEYLAEQGYQLIVHFNQSKTEAEELGKQLTINQVPHVFLQSDLADITETLRKFKALPSSFQKIDILINSASSFPENDSWENVEQYLEPLLTLNAISPIRMIKALEPYMNQGAQVVNILDARLNQVELDHFSYRLSKHLLKAATRYCAKALAPEVRVNGIAFGAILAPPGKGDAHLSRLADHILLKKTGDLPAAIRALDYLIQQPFVTGEILTLDGGEFL